MSKTRYIASNGLPDFLASLSKLGLQVLAPTQRPSANKPVVVFAPWQKGDPVILAKAHVPPKGAVLPESEVLVSYKKVRSAEDLNQKELQIQTGPEESPETVIFGCRPCDARCFTSLDEPYLHGLFEDPYYKAKREKLTVISFTCNTGCETCFCHWVGGGPTSPTGSDLLLTDIGEGYVLQAVTEKGQALLEKVNLEEGQDKIAALDATRKAAWASLVPAPQLKDAPEKLKSLFTNDAFWEHWTARCISCGACTYFCPTCYCFNITDEGDPQGRNGGKRLRSWDNCMSSRYTREASGHNPRAVKFQRMRNRVSHKFWTFFENWGSFLCSGCGRCISNCPVHLDIRAIVLAAIEEGTPKDGD